MVNIEINLEIDTSEKIIFISEENSSGVKEKYHNIKEIGKCLEEYIKTYCGRYFEN